MQRSIYIFRRCSNIRANALSSADSVMNTTRSSAGDFSSALSKSLSDGELLLGQASSSASTGLTELATTAGKINTSVSDALGYANSVNELNADILKKCRNLPISFRERSEIRSMHRFLPCKLRTSQIRN